MSITIRDVARAAGVSVATVSRVFNHRGLVRDVTRSRVMDAATELGYLPNATARSLSNGTTNALGMVLPVPHGEFFSEIIRGFDERAQQDGYHMLISSSHNRLEETHAAFETMAGRVDGLAVMSPHVHTQPLVQRVRAQGPAVVISPPVEEGAAVCDTFVIQNQEGARAATRHLIALGHRRIGVIQGPSANIEVQERLRGYREALAEADLAPDPALEFEGGFSQESGYQMGRRLAAMPQRPTAVFAFNDYMAFGALRAFYEVGLRVPEDIALVGFDDITSARYTHPPLTSVHVPVWELGRRVADRLITCIGQAAGEPERFVVPTHLEVRASTTG